jgi:integrase
MCRHYFDAIQSYCDTLNLEVYDREQFKQFRDENLQTTTNPNFDSTSVFTLDEIERLVSALDSPERDFVVLQYIHCRRPGEVKELRAEDIHLDKREVIYPIKKQKYGEDNRRAVDVVNEREYQYLEQLKTEGSGLLFPTAQRRLESVRKPFREARDRLGITQLPLKNLRHTRISQLKSVRWEPVQIRDTYTHHKQLSTLQDKYLSSVDEALTEEQLWGIVPTVGQAGQDDGDVVGQVIARFGLNG